MRTCKKCKASKLLGTFTPNKNCNPPFEHECLQCSVKRRVSWEYNNQEKRINTYLKSKYGITKKHYDYLVLIQDGLCYICHKPELDNVPNKRKKQLAVDHRHSDGRIRGLLCRRCNTGLGSFQDNVSFLERAIKYLLKQ